MHQIAKLIGEDQQLEDPLSPPEPGAAAVVAPRSSVDLVRHLALEQMPECAGCGDFLLALLADRAHEALRQDAGDRRGEQIRSGRDRRRGFSRGAGAAPPR